MNIALAMDNISRRQGPYLLALLLLFSVLSLALPANPTRRTVDQIGLQRNALQGDAILYNGRIHTMDADNRIVSVVAIRDGTIIYVGDDRDQAVESFGIVDTPTQIDLGQHMAIPGLIDNHNHIVLMGNRPGYHTPLENAYCINDILETYRARAADVPKGEFITTLGGFHPTQFAENRLPTLEELDEALPNHPAYIMVGFRGASVTNTLGKKWFETVADPQVPVHPNGTLRLLATDAPGDDSGRAILALRRQITFEDRKRGARDAMRYAASLGVTTHLDEGAFPFSNTVSDGIAHDVLETMHDSFLEVYSEGHGIVRLRINFLHMDSDDSLPTLSARLNNTFRFFGNDMIRTGAIGEFIAIDNMGSPVFRAAARKIVDAGWRLEVHSLTSTDYVAQIQTFEDINREKSIAHLRWVVAHANLITEEYIHRLNALGGGLSLTAYQYLGGLGPQAGPPYKDIIESGIPVGLSSDGMQIAPMNPWIHAYYATTGRNALGENINLGQQIGRADVLRLYTSANQWFLGGPDEFLLGSIEVGRLGDLVVLNKDYFEVEDEELRSLHSVLTVVGGVVVHETEELGCS